MYEIAVPRLNGNDDSCHLTEWSVPHGGRVDEENPVAVVETSKAAAEIYGDTEGILHHEVPVGVECRVGQTIGYVFSDEQERQEYLLTRPARSAAEPVGSADDRGFTLTAPARRLAAEAGLTEEQLRSLGKRIVREADVEALVQVATVKEGIALTPRQRMIARVVSRTHQTVPDAFVAVKVPCDALLDRLRAFNTEHQQTVGLPEAVIKLLAGLKPSFPAFFGHLVDGEHLTTPGPGAGIGVTIDVGTGLFVPVVRDAETLTIVEITDRLMDFRIKALRDSFHEDDLGGGQLSVSLNTDPDVLMAVPIILAPQVAMVSIASVQTELVLKEGTVTQRRHFSAGLAYDHRAVNGREAVQFLTAFRTAVEKPQEAGL
ncbi:2-oxo acid dehydrogenase subunit E2 [Streptomyces sp. NPDC058683]|uniref:2-oxo acid dehydrogenase subunit E2 n=1 Tax=Streptomyces sp. NPDC058683 TaxID=3346597 RepID=UPI0036483BD8